MKHLLSIQDLSCVGRCSLTVALPTISAMGVRCSVLPTAVLSTHTAFPNPDVVSLTERIGTFADHWQENNICFDAISVGYLSDPEQGEAVSRLLDRFDAPVILDPVMGDHGKLYSRITAAHLAAVKKLCAKADVLLPNVTEAAFLTGLPYREAMDEAYLKELAEKLLDLGAKSVIITGTHYHAGQIGFFGADRNGTFSYEAGLVDRKFHGTGDLFAAVLAGALAQEKTLYDSAKLSAEFVRRCVLSTKESTPHGVEFEKELGWLFSSLSSTETIYGR